MSPTLLEALLLFGLLFSTLSLIGCVGWLYQVSVWWHEQRLIPRPVSLSPALPVPLPVRFPAATAPVLQLERPLPVRLEPVSGELVLFEGSRYEGEVLGLLRLEPTDGEGGG